MKNIWWTPLRIVRHEDSRLFIGVSFETYHGGLGPNPKRFVSIGFIFWAILVQI